MSWLRSALSRAAEATGAGKPGSNIGRARIFVQNAGNAVAGGAKIVLERAVKTWLCTEADITFYHYYKKNYLHVADQGYMDS